MRGAIRPSDITIGRDVRNLPEGLFFGLPHEEHLTRTGRTCDGTGSPPQPTEPVFTGEQFAENRDSAFDHAVNLLSGRG
ncbi:hypothetical protein [Streptomyces sp. NPDC001307]|uniref:hypothetical protein n=1 Tax=Streptomyces sp. NPDC001307 TaxID=3364560 RepID=UPI0036CE54B2